MLLHTYQDTFKPNHVSAIPLNSASNWPILYALLLDQKENTLYLFCLGIEGVLEVFLAELEVLATCNILGLFLQFSIGGRLSHNRHHSLCKLEKLIIIFSGDLSKFSCTDVLHLNMVFSSSIHLIISIVVAHLFVLVDLEFLL